MRRLGTFLSIILMLTFAIVSCSDMIPWLEAGFIKEGDTIIATDSSGNPVSIEVKDKKVVVKDNSPEPANLIYDERDPYHDPDKGNYVLKFVDNDETRYVMHVDYEGGTIIEQRFTYEEDGKTVTEMVPVTTEKVMLTAEKPMGLGDLAVGDLHVNSKSTKSYLMGSKVAYQLLQMLNRCSLRMLIKKEAPSSTAMTRACLLL
jgi:hypothetical protein